MKLYVILAMVFATGLLASLAIAKPPPGKGNPHRGAAPVATTTTGATDTTSTTTATATTGPSGGRVILCHRTGSKTNPWVRVTVAGRAVTKRLAKGDVLPVGGKCPAAKTKPSGDGGTDTATTGATTTTATITTTTTATTP